MRRRHFITGLGSTALSPLIARAQEPVRSYRVGSIHLPPWEAPHYRAFRSSLRRLGFVERYNLWLDRNSHGLRREQFGEHAAQVVKTGADAIHCSGDRHRCCTARDDDNPNTWSYG